MDLSGGKGYVNLDKNKLHNIRVANRAASTEAFNNQLADDADIAASMRGYKTPGAFGLAQLSVPDADRLYQQDLQNYFQSSPTQAVAPVVTAPGAVIGKRVAVKDPAIVALQERLNANGAGLKVDGVNGPKTQQAVFNERNKADQEVVRYYSGDRPEYVPGPIQQTTQLAVPVAPEGLAAKASGNGLDDSVAYWLSGDAPEGYVPTAKYNSFLDMFK